MKRSEVEIIECTDSSAFYLIRYIKVMCKYILMGSIDIKLVFIGFLGQPLVPLIGMFTSKPIIFDAFLSIYDTMCDDRKKCKPTSYAGRLFYWLDKHSCERADRILLDTNAHINYFTKTFNLPREKFSRLFVGADESLFYPRENTRDDSKFRIFYYSSFLPLHGTEYILKAAALLRNEGEIEFIIVGNGPEKKKARNLGMSLGLINTHFIDWLPYEQLPMEIAKADVCLGGHFSDIDKATRVIAGKTYQFIAMKKPVIVGDCPANDELFKDKKNALFVKMADAESLVNAILELRDNATLREQIAEAGYKTFLEKCSIAVIGKELKKIMETY